MITSRDVAYGAAAPMRAPALPLVKTTPLAERILLVILFVTVLASSVAFIEPSPHDGLMGLLAIAGLIAGLRFDRTLVVPFLLLVVWNVAGLLSLLNVPAETTAIQYVVTSFYLGIAGMIFACLFAQNTMPRLAAMRSAYLLTAAFVSIVGAIGYFRMFPGAAELFAGSGRASGLFKDPNVFGPFLILPILFVLERLLVREFKFIDFVLGGITLFGLLLSFSRGAWFHFAVSGAVLVAMAFLTAPNQRTRMRVFVLSALTIGAMIALLTLLLSFSSIGEMFRERAQLIQHYDVGEGGRFRLQELALGSVLNFPNGMGPFEFARVYGLQQHNVYLQAFLVYGWAGALTYFILLLATLWVGFRAAFVRTPWQPYLIAAYAAFVGEMAEGIIVDTDHWRHFYLILGIIWGLAAATKSANQRAPTLPVGISR